MIDRRTALKLAGAGYAASLAGVAAEVSGKTPDHAGEEVSGTFERTGNGSTAPFLVSSTQDARWRLQGGLKLVENDDDPFDVSFTVDLANPRQTMAGFGGAFSEMGWHALSALTPGERARALDALFGSGAGLTHCRTPLGTSDMAPQPYSYDEVAGDFALEHFDIGRDRAALVPFIQAAQAREPNLTLWASPWTPPRWMKTNGAYEMAQAWPGKPANGLRPDQVRHEGEDAFIQKPEYLAAYARYFGRYVDAYAREGIAIRAVMPQNEFNSAQPYVSCVWSTKGLAHFLPYLGREMEPRGVEVLLGTLERGNAGIVQEVLADPGAAAVVRGVGVQWAGREALPQIARDYPDLAIWGSEQECGVGTNDWHYARYNWRVLKDYLENGASVWTYWNLALDEGGASIAGWPQNSLVAVDMERKSWRLTHDYWALRHTSAHVRPGARYLPTPSSLGYEFQTAFRNRDGSVVVVMLNDMAEPVPRSIVMGSRKLHLTLPADSFNTLVMPAASLGQA